MKLRSLLRIAILAFGLFTTAHSWAADPATFTVGDYVFKRPESWKWVSLPSGSMRKAELQVEGPSGNADATFFDFGPGQGGDVEANITRWIGQFQETEDKLKPVIEAATVNNVKVTRVSVSKGTFNSGMPGQPTTPQENYALLGAIIENPHGNVFIKLTGPSDTVRNASKEFEGMLESALRQQ